MAKKPSIQKVILKTLSSKKVVSSDTVKQNVSKSINSNEKNKIDYAISRSIKNLVSDGLIESFDSDHCQYFRLTDEGRQRLNNIKLESDYSLVSTKWDGFWRLILLDLPENRKNEREALRYLLKKAGFICVKNSVWISVYPFEHLFTNIKKDLGLSTEMMIIVTDKIDNDTEREFLDICEISYLKYENSTD